MCKKIISVLLCMVITVIFAMPTIALENTTTTVQEIIEPISNTTINTELQTLAIDEDFPNEKVIYHTPDTPIPTPRKVSSFVTADGIDLGITIENENSESGFGTASEQTRASSFTDSYKEIELSPLNSATTEFKDIISAGQLLIDSDASNYYFVLQGCCTDGEYYYFSFLVKYKIKDPNDPSEILTFEVDTRILCCRKNADGSFTKVALAYNLMDFIHHANDMTYNSDTDEVIIVCCEDGYYNEIYRVDADELQDTWGQTFYCEYVGCRASNIDYNATHGKYVVGLSGYLNYFAILDNDFQVIKTIGYASTGGSWVRQGICADENYIYSICYYLPDSKGYTDENENRIRIFDWEGNYIKTLNITVINGTNHIYELESIMFADGDFLLSFNCKNGVERFFKYVLLSDYTFYIQYCPDENVENYIGEYNNGNISSVMIRGLSTPLFKAKVSKNGKKFCGWYAYRAESDTWYYESPDSRPNGWYKEGQQPSGYEKYYYLDEQNVSLTGNPGEHVYMCAIWGNISIFFVKFLSNEGIGDEYGMTVFWGQSTQLKANQFTKNNREFVGWNAYWVEKNKWYYQDTDSNNRGWYKEGYQPVGYVKYVYNDGQSVAQTVHAGNHVQMHALWDEFYIQYNPNYAVIKVDKIKKQETGRYKQNIQNPITLYTNSDLHNKPTQNITISKFSFYRKEINKWLYEDANGNRGWYYAHYQPSGYTLYYKYAGSANYIGATAPPGEHLVIYAHWELI